MEHSVALLENFFFGCGHCDGTKGCAVSNASEKTSASPLGRGRLLVFSCVIVFIMPLAVAIGAAHLAGAYRPADSGPPLVLYQAGGAAAGFALGVMVARWVITILRRRFVADGEN